MQYQLKMNSKGVAGNEEKSLFRIPPYHYLHVLDATSNATRVELGPQTFIRQENEKVVFGPEAMVTVPPRSYVVILNPAMRDDQNAPLYDSVSKQVKLRHAEQEVRLSGDPFPLFPGEVLKKGVTPLQVVNPDSALRLKAVLDYVDVVDGKSIKRVAGDEWLFEGPGTYIPKVEVSVEETIRASVIKPNQALLVRARKETVDRDGTARVTGEEYLIRKVGAYLPQASEEVLTVIDAYVLTDKKALHLRATRTFKDDLGIARKNGQEWLIKQGDADTHIPSVHEEVIGLVDITTLTNRQYCVILNPVDKDGVPQLGQKKLLKGPSSRFLEPGEKLEKGIQDVFVLEEDEGLILKASEAFTDGTKNRTPGDRWMIRGPTEYVPPVEVEVVCKRKAIPLDDNEGIYVRDTRTGKVCSVTGSTYMLKENEELWSKELSPAIEVLLQNSRDPLADRAERPKGAVTGPVRDKTKVITFRVPHNAAVQIYDYKDKKARVVFGPELVMLGPDEQFTQLSLSGGKPKRPNEIKSLVLLMGPDFCTDVITIETADHARLQLQLSYNWHFKVDKKSPDSAATLFSVPDFVGDLCKAVASRVRGAVAGVQFDDFHKNSARIIRSSVFGVDENGKVRDSFHFPSNNLYITSVDIQSAEPVDQRTRDALQKSVQLAIEITTNSQEANAKHSAELLEQEAKGLLERQRIKDEAKAEEARRNLIELQALSAAVESTGQAKAEAQSRAEAARIEGEAAVDQARLKAQAVKIESESELERLTAARNAETLYIKEQNEMELAKVRRMADIEISKMEATVKALGADTIRSIACSPQELQVKLLQALNLQTSLITDGNSPINLFNTAQGLVSSGAVTTLSTSRS